MGPEPLLGFHRLAIGAEHGCGDAKNGVGLLLGQIFLRADEMAFQFDDDLFGEVADVVVERGVFELQVVVRHEFLDVIHGEGHTHGDADGAGRGSSLMMRSHLRGTVRAGTFQRLRQAHHLWLVKEGLARAAFIRVHHKWCRTGWPRQGGDGLAGGVARTTSKCVDIDDLAAVTNWRLCRHHEKQ